MGIFNMMELANTQQADANKPDEVVEVNKNEAGKVDDDTTIIKNQNNVIELKGSLSEVYTKALNAEYALENIQSIVSSIVDSKSDSELNPMYVHVADADGVGVDKACIAGKQFALIAFIETLTHSGLLINDVIGVA